MPPPVTGKELRRWTKQIRSLERAGDTDAVWASARELAERYAESAEARVVLGEMYIHLGETSGRRRSSTTPGGSLTGRGSGRSYAGSRAAWAPPAATRRHSSSCALSTL